MYEQFAANLGFSNLSFQVLSFVGAIGKKIVLHQTYFCTNLPMTERATLELVKVAGRRGWEVRQAPERRRKKHIDL